MANSSTAFNSAFATMWDDESEEVLARNLVSRAISNTRLNNKMAKGDTFKRMYWSALPRMRSSVRYTDGTLRNTTLASESLSVNQEPEVWTDVQKSDEIQSQFGLMADLKRKLLPRVQESVDGDIIAYAAANAGSSIDDSNLNPGGVSGNGMAITSSNVFDMCVLASKKLMKFAKANAAGSNFWMITSPDIVMAMKQSVYAKDTTWGDGVGKNGEVGDNFAGFKVMQSASTYFTAYLALATDPADGDTVSIELNADAEVDNGTKTLTIRFKTTTAAAMDVQRGSGVNTTRVNLAAFINDAGANTTAANTDATTYWTPTDAQRDYMQGWTATNDAAAGVTIKMVGFGAATLTKSLTAAADGWTAAKQLEYTLFGVGKPIYVVTQAGARVDTKPYGNAQRKDLLCGWTLYGRQVWRDTKFQILAAKVRSDSYGAN